MKRWLALAAVMVAMPARASAAPAVRLVTEGDACDLQALPARVRALLGRERFDRDAAATVHVELASSDGRASARVTFEDADGGRRGPRRLEAASCDALVDSIALVIAMGMPEDTAPPSPAPAPAPRVAPTPEPTLGLHATAASPGQPTANELAVIAGGAAGLSSNGWQQQLAVGLRWRHARHSLALELRLSVPEARAVAPMGQVAIATTTASAVACRHFGELAVCAALSIGAIRGSGSGLFDAREAAAPLVAGGARLGWEHEVWRGLRAHLEVGAEARATTSRFDVDHMPVWESSRFQGWAGAGVIARFL